jgi:hypothetical protein
MTNTQDLEEKAEMDALERFYEERKGPIMPGISSVTFRGPSRWKFLDNLGLAKKFEEIAGQLKDESRKKEALESAARNYETEAGKGEWYNWDKLEYLKKASDLYKIVGKEENVAEINERINQQIRTIEWHAEQEISEIQEKLSGLDEYRT